MRYSRFLTALVALTGCEPLPPVEVTISQVEIVRGDPSSTDFLMRIDGRGFGLSGLSYQVGEGHGSTETTGIGLQVFDEMSFVFSVPRSQLTLLSPHRLEAHLVLPTQLAPGSYGVRLTDGEIPVAEKPLAFEVP